ncbi:MAG TPA: hypothetical protein VGN63_18765 [Flavisolibacter sp.]|jgi:hypothetical protein|nr:hypothetical protein [Flavisolibacter sp.]
MEKYLKMLNVFAEESDAVTKLALSVLGASILAMISTSYLKPSSRKWRWIYLLFIPGWVLTVISVYFGALVKQLKITGNLYPSPTSNNEEILRNAVAHSADYFVYQSRTFSMSILFYTLWIVLFAIWWIINKESNEKKIY